MLNVGIIGLGPDWETRYRPALARLSGRLRVAAIYDPVAPRAARAAAELQAVCVGGVRALVGRPDIRAVLVFDPAWRQLAPLRFALDGRKSAFIPGHVESPASELELLSRKAAEDSLIVCPELRLRTAPATTRIMELTATSVGRVQTAEVRVNVIKRSDTVPSLVAVIDACGTLVRSLPTAIEIVRSESGLVVSRVAFARLNAEGQPVQAVIAVSRDPERRSVSSLLTCERGTIRQSGNTELSWRVSGCDETVEQLDLERPAVEVLLDHFARRVVGGLVPIPGLDDVCRILRLLEPHRSALTEVE